MISKLSATQQTLRQLAQSSSLHFLPWRPGERHCLCAYYEARQELCFLGQDQYQGADTLYFLTLSDLNAKIRGLRIGGGAKEIPVDKYYGGTRVTFISFNSTGEYLLLVGSPHDSSPYLGVVDLRDEEPRGGSVSRARRLSHRRLLPQETRSQLLKAAWHPLSKTHVVVLLSPPHAASGAELRIYDTAAIVRVPELIVGVDADIRSFCFGPDVLWQRFSIYLVGSGLRDMKTGEQAPRLLALCPIIPFRAQVQATAIKELQDMLSEELTLDQTVSRRKELRNQLALLTACYGDISDMDYHGGPGFIHLRCISNRASLVKRLPSQQEISYLNPPSGLQPESLDLLNPKGSLPALAVTFAERLIDVLVLPVAIEPQFETDLPSFALDCQRFAQLHVRHHAESQSVPLVIPDPSLPSGGTFFLITGTSIIEVSVPQLLLIDGRLGVEEANLLQSARCRMTEIHRLQGPADRARACGACRVDNAPLGRLLIARRWDGDVDVVNLALLYCAPEYTEQSSTTPTDLSIYVPFDAACKADLHRLKQGRQYLCNLPASAGIAQLKQDILEKVIVPLRSLQTRAVFRANELTLLYEKARGAAKVLGDRLHTRRQDFIKLRGRVDEAERQLEMDQKTAEPLSTKLRWVRSVITPFESRQHQAVLLAEARLLPLEGQVKVLEESQAQEGEITDGTTKEEEEQTDTRLRVQIKNLARDVELMEELVTSRQSDGMTFHITDYNSPSRLDQAR